MLHPVFGEFEDNLHDLSLQTPGDHAFVREFCDKSGVFFKKEKERENVIWGLLKEYLRNITSPKIETGSIISCDGCITGNSPFPIYAILVVENELGSTKTMKYFQGMAYYARFCIQGMESKSSAYLSSTCPPFLIEIQGPQIRVSAMTFQDGVTSTFLTDIVNIVHSNSMKLASVFTALRMGLDSLAAFYDSIPGKAEGSKRLPFLDSVVPYSFQLYNPKYSFQRRIDGKQLVFLAEDANKREVVIKFCRRYGDKVCFVLTSVVNGHIAFIMWHVL